MHTTAEKNARASSGVTVGRVSFCLDVFFVLMLLLNGGAMLKSAEQLEFGRTRDFWVAVLRPVAMISRLTGFDHIRSGAEETLGGWFNRPVQKKKEPM
jgi:hypothetical protein